MMFITPSTAAGSGLLHFHLPEMLWHSWSWVPLFRPFSQWFYLQGLPRDEPVLGASWQGQQMTLPVIVRMPQDCLYRNRSEQPDTYGFGLGIRSHFNMILNIKRAILPICFDFKSN